MRRRISRRDFLRGSAAGIMGLAVVGVTGYRVNLQTAAEEEAETEEPLPVNAYDGTWEWVYKEDENGTAYYALDVVYCANPTMQGGAAIQHLVVYAPAAYMQENEDGTVNVNEDGSIESSTGIVYTSRTAPILYTNTSGGYVSSSIEAVNSSYIKEGYVQVSINTRGRETVDDDGKYIGQFPAIVTDLKAGVRFLKANNENIPGNADRIVSHGYSSGGALSAMLGSTGNSSVFEEYLEEIGAADATDDIFIALCYCPITNLNTADAAYEWYQYGNDQYFLFNAMAYDREGNEIEGFAVGRENMHDLGDNVLGGAHEDELAALLYKNYVEYIQKLGFDLSDDGLGGAYYDGLTDLYSQALTEYLARYDSLDYTDEMYATAADYLESLRADEEWFDYNEETGEVTFDSLTSVMTHVISRNKMCPSLDSYNYRSNEGSAFVTEDGERVHFSAVVRDALKTLIDEADTYGWTEDELAYIEVLYEDYEKDVTKDATEMLEIMSPINYVLGTYDADMAPYFRWHVGGEDGDHGLPAAWLTHNALLTSRPEVQTEISVIWGKPHTAAEYDQQDLFDYISEVMKAEDNL